MAQGAAKGAGLSVGTSEVHDPKLARCAAAATSAREVAEALDAKLVRGVRVIANPPTFDALYGELQKALREAKGGTFFLYFAGHALRRGDDLLLTVGESEVEGAKGCVSLADVIDLLRRASLAHAL